MYLTHKGVRLMNRLKKYLSHHGKTCTILRNSDGVVSLRPIHLSLNYFFSSYELYQPFLPLLRFNFVTFVFHSNAN